MDKLLHPENDHYIGAKLLAILIAILAVLVLIASVAPKAQAVPLCDPFVPSRCAKVTSTGAQTTVPGGTGQAVTVTRPNDTSAYLANDVIGAATGATAALSFGIGPTGGGEVVITSVSLEIDASAVISGETSYRLYLYSVTPPSALGDNAAWDLPAGDRASFLGYVDLGTPVDLGSTLFVQTLGVNKQLRLASSTVFGYLVTVGAYTPTAQRVYIVTLRANPT